MNPIIEVDGDRATGRWRLLCPCTVEEDEAPAARWILAQYDEVYERHGDRWFYRSLSVNVNFNALHEAGWADTPAS